jgi:hypothetical protein
MERANAAINVSEDTVPAAFVEMAETVLFGRKEEVADQPKESSFIAVPVQLDFTTKPYKAISYHPASYRRDAKSQSTIS